MELLENKISLIKEDVTKLASSVSAFIVKDDDTQRQAIDLLTQIKTRQRRIEDLRKEFTSPLNDQVKKINNMFKAQSEPLVELEGKIKTTLKSYMDEQDRKAREEAERLYQEKLKKEQEEQAKIDKAKAEEEKLLAEAQKATNEKNKARLEEMAKLEREKQEQAQKALEQTELQIVEAPKKSVRTESGLATRKMVWKWKVTDEKALRTTRPELFILDEKTVNKLVNDGERDIAGIEVYQESELAIKA